MADISLDGDMRALHRELLDAWNRRDAAGMAALFADHGSTVGFDGSEAHGKEGIEAHLAPIFLNHPTAAYVSKVRSVRPVGDGVAVLMAVAGMVPPDSSDINPAVNAIQSLIAAKRDGKWRVELFQNTPAAFHGRPELTHRLTEELRAVLTGKQAV